MNFDLIKIPPKGDENGSLPTILNDFLRFDNDSPERGRELVSPSQLFLGDDEWFDNDSPERGRELVCCIDSIACNSKIW